MNLSTRFALAALLFALLVFSGCASAPDTQKVRVGYLPIIGDLPLFIAQDHDFFSQNGVEIETFRFESTNLAVDALVRGDIDLIAEAGINPALNVQLIDPGKLMFFSTSDLTADHPFDRIIIKKDSTISSLSDLAGKKIGVFPGSTPTVMLKHFLQQEGVDITNVEFVQLTPPNQLPALESESIAALLSFEPTSTIALESGDYQQLYPSVFAKMLNHSPQGVSIISTKFVREQPEQARKVVAAFDQAVDYMKSNEEDVRATTIPKHFNLPLPIAQKVELLYMSRSDHMNKEAVQQYIDLMVQLGDLKSSVSTTDLFYSPQGNE